ncbi:MAG: hypothetical protein GTN62_02650 [Gemmatimonadales bacterium]|nr:hypothetical protein [Gemmatimonadales bacterium]NIN10671.1 hypothetical protein [Gemmatimonadales bacterium]NIN48998.1 hypothetical protein [Gemmatimonadales bacterium]NIP06462.1 hypothetical protein [Gemmatimonadales bacterium]NIQ98808.1 hypothetical protein [Gemmatimonadales bacterium]
MRAIPTVAAFAGLVLAACGGDGSERALGSLASGQAGGGTVVSVQVIGPGNLELGSSGTFHAIAFTADGDSTYTDDVTWSTSDDAVLSVTGNGSSAEVKAVGDGAAEVLASIQGVTGSRTVHIGPVVVGPVESIELIPSDQVIVIRGDSALGSIEAILRDAAGNRILDQSVTWSVSDPTVLAFRSRQATFALLEGLKPGTATVTAEAEGKSGSASVTVR